MSVRLKLTLWYSGVLALTLLAFSFTLYFIMDRNLNEQVNTDLVTKAIEVIRSIRVEGGYPQPVENINLPNVDAFATPNTYLQVLDFNGQIVAHSNNLGNQVLPLSEKALLYAREGRSLMVTTGVGENRIRIYNQPLIWRGQTIGVLQVGRSLVPLNSTLNRLRIFLITGTLITVLFAGLMGWFLAKAVLLPVGRVTEAADSIQEARDLDRRIEYYGPRDELGKLVHTINSMLDRLKAAYRRLEEAHAWQKRFVADASHELRTPLTTIRGNVELIQRMGCNQPEVQKEALEDIASEAARMSRMVHDLLLLARADAGYRTEASPVELAPVLHEVARQGGLLAGEVIFNTGNLDVGGKLLGDTDALKQLFLILLDNAFKYTPPGGQVWLEALVAGGEFKVMVRDTGIGIEESEKEHIFERFYRADRNRKGGGTGLGLAIAKLITTQYGGDIMVESEPGKGTIFTVHLPVLG